MILIAAIWIILLVAIVWTVADYRKYVSRYNVTMTYWQFLRSYWNRIWRLVNGMEVGESKWFDSAQRSVHFFRSERSEERTQPPQTYCPISHLMPVTPSLGTLVNHSPHSRTPGLSRFEQTREVDSSLPGSAMPLGKAGEGLQVQRCRYACTTGNRYGRRRLANTRGIGTHRCPICNPNPTPRPGFVTAYQPSTRLLNDKVVD